MNSKLALIVMVLVSSTAFVPSTPAQQPPLDRDTALTLTAPPQPDQPSPALPGPPVTNRLPGAFYQFEPDRVSPFVPRWNTAPGEANLAQEADQLARQLGVAKSDGERDKLKDKLGEVLAKQFDQRQKRHEREIASLEAQVKKLKDLVEKRQENRREIIARRLEQILRESQGLGW